jgi:hypothetical protein
VRIVFFWLMSPDDRTALEAVGWRECYRHAIYGTPLMFRVLDHE